MKIVFLSHLDLNLYLFRLPIMKELVKRGNQVYAVVPKGEYLDRFEEHGITSLEYNINRRSLNPLVELKTILKIKRIIEDLKPDILHTFMHKPNIYGNLTGHERCINTITGLGSFFIHGDIKSILIKTMIENLYRLSTKNAIKVIFQNPDDMDYFLKKRIVPESKAVLIKSSGVDTEFFKPQPKNEKLLRELKIDTSKPVVLMIARVIKDKGVLEYIEAAERLKDKATFIYAGDIDNGNRSAFKPDFKSVEFLGFREDIKDLISIADIVVLPSYYREGVPRTLLEAGAMGKPLVTTDAPGCREVVKDGYNGFLVPAKDSETLAKKIQILIEDENLRLSFGENSRKHVKENFDIKLVVSKYIELYESILKQLN